VNFVAKGTIEEGMLSVLAFKRSLAAGILDGDSGEISLGGSRLSRFMKDVENVTGHMGEGEVLTPAEEMGNAGTVDDAGSAEDANADAKVGVGAMPVARLDGSGSPAQATGNDPWQALMNAGAQFVAALAFANDPNAPAHPWIERDPVTGAQSLKIPLPPPDTARRLADAVSALADGLRGRA
ncbi:MAG: ATP-dependent helicase, partial [Gammaproteobacteria bacterium]